MACVSVPYSQGHRMRRIAARNSGKTSREFQSPIHRVIGCDRGDRVRPGTEEGEFQSPIHRVIGCDRQEVSILLAR